MKPVCAILNTAACHSARTSAGARKIAVERAFTLVELLVVISIIGLLAGLFLGIGGVATLKGREGRIRAELQHHNTVIESYIAKIGAPPPSGDCGMLLDVRKMGRIKQRVNVSDSGN